MSKIQNEVGVSYSTSPSFFFHSNSSLIELFRKYFSKFFHVKKDKKNCLKVIILQITCPLTKSKSMVSEARIWTIT